MLLKLINIILVILLGGKMLDIKTNFYLNNLFNSISKELEDKLFFILKDAFYARIFEKEQTLLVQKKENINGRYTSQLYAYSLENINFKFKVEIPKGYFLVYCLEVGESKSMGMICKPIDINNFYAIEYAIEKENGRLSKVRQRLCTENINQANCINNSRQNCLYPVTELTTNQQNHTVSWKYNFVQKYIRCKENIVYAVYHDFEEVILLLTSDNDDNRSAYLYNLDGSMKLKLELPKGFKISYCPTQYFEYDRTVVLLICHNPDISTCDDLKYIIVPDNGDLIYIGRQR